MSKIILGLVGGVGNGKSTVTGILKNKYDFTILYTDDIAKELELPGRPVYKKLCEALGNDILTGCKEGECIDKEKFAKIIYSDRNALKMVSDIIHPAVWKYVGDYIAEAVRKAALSEDNTDVRIAVETALPNENFVRICDTVWYICASDEVRIKRLMQSRGYTREKCLSIIDSQKKREELYREADEKIDNSQTLSETEKQIAALMKKYNTAVDGNRPACG